MSRIWGGGWGGQCTLPQFPGGAYCDSHEKQLKRQGYLTHGRIDGPIPPKKRKEFEMWQGKLKKQHASSDAAGSAEGNVVTLTDGTGFDESSWRSMGVGAGESRRAYRYRTGQEPAPDAASARPRPPRARPKEPKSKVRAKKPPAAKR
ncbi:unnamed protein product [Polarella glacialis]|uniref:Uncharacterized protein n=1 Tax=Polarella glacialis TaxID=89957 RepID=A0A813GBK7_POLGL|nr:unnamed protein product [Polarella glacialis]